MISAAKLCERLNRVLGKDLSKMHLYERRHISVLRMPEESGPLSGILRIISIVGVLLLFGLCLRIEANIEKFFQQL